LPPATFALGWRTSAEHYRRLTTGAPAVWRGDPARRRRCAPGWTVGLARGAGLTPVTSPTGETKWPPESQKKSRAGTDCRPAGRREVVRICTRLVVESRVESRLGLKQPAFTSFYVWCELRTSCDDSCTQCPRGNSGGWFEKSSGIPEIHEMLPPRLACSMVWPVCRPARTLATGPDQLGFEATRVHGHG
jgi:hypothetical protein